MTTENTENSEKNAIVVQTNNYQYYIIHMNGLYNINPKVVINPEFYKKYVKIMSEFENLQKELAELFRDQK